MNEIREMLDDAVKRFKVLDPEYDERLEHPEWVSYPMIFGSGGGPFGAGGSAMTTFQIFLVYLRYPKEVLVYANCRFWKIATEVEIKYPKV